MNVLQILVAKRVEESSQLGRLRVHLRRLYNVLHTYYCIKSLQRHGQKIIVNYEFNGGSIMIISKTINKIGGDLAILRHTSCCKLCQPCISTKVIKLLLDACSFKELRTRICHGT